MIQQTFRNHFYLAGATAAALGFCAFWLALTHYGRPLLFSGVSRWVLYLAPVLASCMGLAVAHSFDRRQRSAGEKRARVFVKIFAIYSAGSLAMYFFVGVVGLAINQWTLREVLQHWYRSIPNAALMLALGIPISVALFGLSRAIIDRVLCR